MKSVNQGKRCQAVIAFLHYFVRLLLEAVCRQDFPKKMMLKREVAMPRLCTIHPHALERHQCGLVKWQNSGA